ncbi:MAG: acyl-CoA thioesterase [Chitinophagales bacterium]|jgi:acyl-CoA hydrolase|nr:acyl-CoA thioesterase [Chitinophagales bacterium]MBP6154769.1 acyl-CoA thioesterase [Chitinophagales bacterium]HQV78959.1 acyl-CoA thioesterase [Chitinophagales bacterium]HQW68166.1 acyl-CoA thioesterase [Flavobacterium sp.]HQW68209.1 acyl-CoA thioesterase [Flavobacterium sp.]
MEARKVSETLNIQTELIMPAHTNPIGNLMGGHLLSWMDVCAGISAIKHSGGISVTAGLDNVCFNLPIKMGDIVVLRSFVTRAFNTSMEVICEVFIKNIKTQEEVRSHEAFFTFVGLDFQSKPIKCIQVIPETEREKKLFEDALQRRELRLINAGKLNPKDSVYLKREFLGDESIHVI